jgi:hypothetical protein
MYKNWIHQTDSEKRAIALETTKATRKLTKKKRNKMTHPTQRLNNTLKLECVLKKNIVFYSEVRRFEKLDG